jgi:hypothetical protein
MPGLAGLVLLAGFVWRQRQVADPILPLDLFRSRNFSAGNLSTLFIAALALNGFVLAVYLHGRAGLSATLAGLASLPSTLLMIALSSRIGTLVGRWGPRLFMTAGPLIMSVGALLLLLVADDFDYWWQVLPAWSCSGSDSPSPCLPHLDDPRGRRPGAIRHRLRGQQRRRPRGGAAADRSPCRDHRWRTRSGRLPPGGGHHGRASHRRRTGLASRHPQPTPIQLRMRREETPRSRSPGGGASGP